MSEKEQYAPGESIPFFPDHVKTEFKVVLGIVGITILVGIAGMIAPVGVGEPADPLNTPMHVKPEWYFLALYQLLKFTEGESGLLFAISLIIIGLLVVTFWPFLNPQKETNQKPTIFRLIITIIGVLIFIALTIWGEVS